MRKNANGFTIIELVAVIVLLGVLAAVAAPKFMGLKSDAKVSILESVAASMKTSLEMVHTEAIIQGVDSGEQSLLIDGVLIPLLDGYPTVDGNDFGFSSLNKQVSAWSDLDSVDRNTAKSDSTNAPLFTDKDTKNKRIYVFFTSDYSRKSVSFGCQIMYENKSEPVIEILTHDC